MKNYSKTFCVYPWLHLSTSPTGRIRYCCIPTTDGNIVNDDSDKYFFLDHQTFQQAWNSKFMKEVRRKMIDGEKVAGCAVCYKQEEIGKKSYRQNTGEEWEKKLGSKCIESVVEASINNNYEVKETPVYLDLRLGSLCNLKCRMCNPYNSVMIEKEWAKLDEKSGNKYSEFWDRYSLKYGSCDNWYEKDNFWNSVEAYIPKLKKVYMTGGEPTMIKGNYRFLEKCRELGHASEIELFFNLNFTNLKDKFIESINGFKWTSINASLDGVGAVNEYIRTPSHWHVSEANFKKLLKQGAGNVGIGVSPVIQIYNVLDIVPLLDFCEEQMLIHNREILIDFLMCYHPDFLDIRILPDNIKHEAIRRLKEFVSRSKFYHKKTERLFFMKNGIDSMINRLEQTMGQEDPTMLNDFLSYTKTLDEQRRQNFTVVFPELNQLLMESGYSYDRTPSMIRGQEQTKSYSSTSISNELI